MRTVDAAAAATQIITRHPENPVLAGHMVPYPAMLTYNAGVAKHDGRYIMVFRNDLADMKARKHLVMASSLGLAFSDDGVHWRVTERPLNGAPGHPLQGCYDPRLTVLDGRYYLCFATTAHCPRARGHRGVCGGIAVSDDLLNWEVLNVSAPDNRNMVLFPERIDGKLVRLERPFAGYLRPNDRFDIWISSSPDGRYWGESKLLIACDEFPICNDKIGPGAPPIRTPRGWLALLHIVDKDPSRRWGWEGNWTKRYSAGLALLDLRDPSRLIGLCREPIMLPDERYPYEVEGMRPYAIFPGGAVLEEDGMVKIYYGASDTVEALATAHVDDLLRLIKPV